MSGLNSKQILLTIKLRRPGNDLQKEAMVPTCLNNFKDLADNSQRLFNCSPQKARGQANDLLCFPSFLNLWEQILSLPHYDILWIM